MQDYRVRKGYAGFRCSAARPGRLGRRLLRSWLGLGVRAFPYLPAAPSRLASRRHVVDRHRRWLGGRTDGRCLCLCACDRLSRVERVKDWGGVGGGAIRLWVFGGEGCIRRSSDGWEDRPGICSCSRYSFFFFVVLQRFSLFFVPVRDAWYVSALQRVYASKLLKCHLGVHV